MIRVITESENKQPLKEGGIYPVELRSEAFSAFEDAVGKILGGDVDVYKLELVPAYGSGGGGRYWYKCDISLTEDIIANLRDPKFENITDVVLPSINIICSADSAMYLSDVNLTPNANAKESDYDAIREESARIEKILLEKIQEHEDELVELLKDYEITEPTYETAISNSDREFLEECAKIANETGHNLYPTFEAFSADKDFEDMQNKEECFKYYCDQLVTKPAVTESTEVFNDIVNSNQEILLDTRRDLSRLYDIQHSDLTDDEKLDALNQVIWSRVQVNAAVDGSIKRGHTISEAIAECVEMLEYFIGVAKNQIKEDEKYADKANEMYDKILSELQLTFTEIEETEGYNKAIMIITPPVDATRDDLIKLADRIAEFIEGDYYGTGRGGSWTTWNLLSKNGVHVSVGEEGADKWFVSVDRH